MKLFKNYSTLIVVYLIVALLTLFLNLVMDRYPLLDFLNYLEGKKYYWVIPSTVLFLFGLWLLDRRVKSKLAKERVEIFNATIRTIQDILQNSYSSMQLLVLDMKDEGVHEEIILKAEKNLDEMKKVIKALADVDPTTIELKELNRNLSIIKMDE